MNGFCHYPLRKDMYIYLTLPATLLNSKVQITFFLRHSNSVDPVIYVSQIMTLHRHAYVSTANMGARIAELRFSC